MAEQEMVKVKNRTSGTVVYKIGATGVRRELYPGMEMNVPKKEIEDLSYTSGGMDLIRNHLYVSDAEVLDELNVAREPEYYLDGKGVANLILNGSLDEFKDALDFAPEGVIDMIKELATTLPMTDSNKMEALLQKTGYDVAKAIQINKESTGANTVEETETKTRRTAQAAPKRRVVKTVSNEAETK